MGICVIPNVLHVSNLVSLTVQKHKLLDLQPEAEQ